MNRETLALSTSVALWVVAIVGIVLWPNAFGWLLVLGVLVLWGMLIATPVLGIGAGLKNSFNWFRDALRAINRMIREERTRRK